jgi:hypothetical protein
LQIIFRSFVNPPEEADGDKVVKFFKEDVLPSIRASLKSNEKEIEIAWFYPRSKPNRVILGHNSINSIYDDEDELGFYYMFYCPTGVPRPGKQVHLFLMAWRERWYRTKNVRYKYTKRLEALRRSLPHREGGIFEVGYWKYLWSCGCVTLADMAENDIRALTDIYVWAFNRTAKRLKKGIREVFKKK